MMMMMNCFCDMVDRRKVFSLIAGTIVRDPHHRESLTCREQVLNLRRTWVQAQFRLSCAIVITTTPWVNKNKDSTLLHYSVRRNRQGHLSIIRNCKWFSSKSPHCQCPKITFNIILADLSTMVHHTNTPLLGKKIDMVSWRNLMASTLLKSYLACFCHVEEISNFFLSSI